jgi:hypothetical protein
VLVQPDGTLRSGALRAGFDLGHVTASFSRCGAP